MGRIDRGRLTVSANIILTASLITRTLTFGLVMLSVYIKVGDDILDTNVIKMMNIPKVFGNKPLGSTVQSIVFSLIAVFVLEFVTGVLGLVGAVGKRKQFLVTAVLMSSLLIIVYTVYIVLISLIYHKTDDIYDSLLQYANAYYYGRWYHMSTEYRKNVYPSFLSKLGCGLSLSEYSSCTSVYKDQIRTYLQTYFGIIITCLLCHIVSIIASEYTYRKLEYKDTRTRLSYNKYYLLLSIRHGIGRSIVVYIQENWHRSKVTVFSVTVRSFSLIANLGLLGLGLTLCGDILITNASLRHIFYQLRFNQYTFYDILIGVAASSVLLGVIGSVVSVVSLIGTWRKSARLLVVGCLSTTILIIPKLIVFILWAVLVEEINDGMKNQLRKQQNGYYIRDYATQISTEWNYMITTLDCCGVDNSNDTLRNYYWIGTWFCCKNSHESRIDPNANFTLHYHYELILSYFGGCGGFRIWTCTEKILYRTRMYIGWFLAIVLLLVVVESVFWCSTKNILQDTFDGSDDNKKRKCSKLCLSTLIVFRDSVTRFKFFLMQNGKRSKAKLVLLASIGLIMILNIWTLCIAVHIRYDTVFGNGDIKELLQRIHITNTNLNIAVENFSTVVSTFSVAAICTVIYSVSVLAFHKCKHVLLIVCVGLWIGMVMSHAVEIGLWGTFLAEVNSSVTDQLALYLDSYEYSHRSEFTDVFSFNWNTLFVKGQCCGVSNTMPSLTSFVGSPWYKYRRDSSNQVIPVQCCTSQTEVYPYDYRYDSSCTNTPQAYHTQGCDTAIEERLRNTYSLPYLVLTSIIVAAEIVCIFTIIISLTRKDNSIYCEHLADPPDKKDVPEINVGGNQGRKVEAAEKDEVRKPNRVKKKRRKHKRQKDKKTTQFKSKLSTDDAHYEIKQGLSVISKDRTGETSLDITKNNDMISANI